MDNEIVTIYTDGSSLGNPGPGGFGIVMIFKGKRKEVSAGYRLTTNNRMELKALIEALKLMKSTQFKIILYTDSKYVADALNKGWLKNWINKNFNKVKNSDLWKEFTQIHVSFNLEVKWVKGHAGNRENETCDRLAREAALYPQYIDEAYEKNIG